MEEYKSNSHKSRQNQNDDIPEKRVEKVVSGSVKSKKKNGLQKITNVFVPEDVDDVKSYIFEDIMVPAVSVADFYDLVGVSGNYTDNKYGWTDIRNASVIHVRDGYMIKLPKALPLN